MSDTFKALLIEKNEDGQSVSQKELSVDDLMEGDVVVNISHSTVNYKDGLSLTGAAPIARSHPMIPGIDFVGIVESSTHDGIKAGDAVLQNGFGLSETHYGAYAEKARVKGEWLVPLPPKFTPAQAAAIGTAGYTAMLCVMDLQDAGVMPDQGPVLVTGAAGGVGSVAVALLAKLGYEVHAATGRPEEADYLKSLGATEIVERSEFEGKPRAMNKERWAGAVDVAGSTVLANVISMIKYGGAVAACGLAAGMDLPTSVAPFILRGVRLLGVDSVQCPKEKRIRAWERLAEDLDLDKLDAMSQTIGFDDLMDVAPKILAGQVRGRLVVEI